MDRRNFLQKSIAASVFTSASVIGAPRIKGINNITEMNNEEFKLNYAPHLGMFSSQVGNDPIAQLNYMADLDFRAFEDNDMRTRPFELQQRMAQTMAERKIRMGVFVAHTIHWHKPSLTSNDKQYKNQFLSEINSSIEVAKWVNAKWITVVPGHLDLSQDIGYQTVNVINILKEAAKLLEEHQITMVLEPLNFRDHPGLFLTKISQAFEICQAVDSPSCQILFDIYHQQIQEGNIIPNIEAAWEKIAYFQIGDNPGRNEPTTGEINYQNIFQYIHNKGFTGILGMEHGNSKKGLLGEQALLKAYRYSDDFQ